jgi:hypothetical protein
MPLAYASIASIYEHLSVIIYFLLSRKQITWRRHGARKTIGPTLPSLYLDDGRLPLNRTYGFNLSSINTDPYMAWLDKQAPSSVVLSSYGTVANPDAAQLEELGNGLCNSGKPFLWVLRSSEAEKLSAELWCKVQGQGPDCSLLQSASSAS